MHPEDMHYPEDGMYRRWGCLIAPAAGLLLYAIVFLVISAICCIH